MIGLTVAYLYLLVDLPVTGLISQFGQPEPVGSSCTKEQGTANPLLDTKISIISLYKPLTALRLKSIMRKSLWIFHVLYLRI